MLLTWQWYMIQPWKPLRKSRFFAQKKKEKIDNYWCARAKNHRRRGEKIWLSLWDVRRRKFVLIKDHDNYHRSVSSSKWWLETLLIGGAWSWMGTCIHNLMINISPLLLLILILHIFMELIIQIKISLVH